jgi:hypothetical protein
LEQQLAEERALVGQQEQMLRELEKRVSALEGR